jgi:hypothetical protein
MLMKTGLNNLLLPMLLLVVNNYIVQHCVHLNNAEQYCFQPGPIWAAKDCSGLFSTILLLLLFKNILKR